MASILIVEDSALVQEMVKMLLEESGHSADVSDSASDAIKMVKMNVYDLILMDLNMPGLRGEAAIRVLRWNLRLETPIIVLSGEITTDTLTSLQPLGISGFVAKTEDFDIKLLREVDRVLNA
ncbi:MAG: response regulator [bacterium]|nr:response regulator [bacterium]